MLISLDDFLYLFVTSKEDARNSVIKILVEPQQQLESSEEPEHIIRKDP